MCFGGKSKSYGPPPPVPKDVPQFDPVDPMPANSDTGSPVNTPSRSLNTRAAVNTSRDSGLAIPSKETKAT